MYALGVLCIGDAVISLIRQAMGTANEYMQSFSMFTYMIAILAFLYTKLYISTRVEVDDKTFHFVNTVYVKPAPDVKRASFIYRQGENDIKKIDKKFPLVELEKYGYIEDLGYAILDKSGAGEKNKLFPVHEIALVMKDGKRFHMNGANYNDKQLKEMFGHVQKVTGIAPEGKLADIL